jgi:hypothetical protein
MVKVFGTEHGGLLIGAERRYGMVGWVALWWYTVDFHYIDGSMKYQ